MYFPDASSLRGEFMVASTATHANFGTIDMWAMPEEDFALILGRGTAVLSPDDLMPVEVKLVYTSMEYLPRIRHVVPDADGAPLHRHA